MLKKRPLVDYGDNSSSSSSSSTPSSPKKTTNPPKKQLKIISYNSLPVTNPLKKLQNFLEDETLYKQLKAEMSEADKTLNKKYRKIEVNSVRGQKVLHLPEASFSRRKATRARNPYYYNVMEEIYSAEIEKQQKQKSKPQPAGGEGKAEMMENELAMVQGNRKNLNRVGQMVVKEIRQSEQVQFDERAYLERKKKIDSLLGQRRNLEPGKGGGLTAMAYKQIEKDVLDLGK